jgi:hypothetical protein
VVDQLDGIPVIGVVEVDLVSAGLAADRPFRGELVRFLTAELAVVLVLALWVRVDGTCSGGNGDALHQLLVGVDEFCLVHLGAELLPEEGFCVCDDGGFGGAPG